MAAQGQEPQPDPLVWFKQALDKYRECQAAFEECEDLTYYGSDTWKRRDNMRRIASEGLWVSGVAGFFSLLETNYKAQELLVAEQLKLAKENSAAAKVTAKWTMVMAIVAAVTIAYTALVGRPVLNLVAPVPQAPVVIPADSQSPQSPTRDP
ncbi:MAG: hypothetical protein WBV96_13415 [Polyangia bacterium]